jgi:hypothetical protein
MAYAYISPAGLVSPRKVDEVHFIPFGLGLLESQALVVVTDEAGIRKTRKVELLGPEEPCHLGHFGG